MNGTRKCCGLAAAVAWCVLAFACGVAAPLVAQTAGETPIAEAALEDATPEEVGGNAAEALEHVAAITEEYRRHKEMLAAASGEDSLVLQLQMSEDTDAFMAGLDNLVGLTDAESDDPQQQELRSRVEALYVAVAPRVGELIADLRGDIDRLRAQRSWTTTVERQALENSINRTTVRLDRVVAFGGRQVQALDAFGLDTSAERENFEGMLTTRADELSGRITLGVLRIGELQGELKDRPGDGDLTLLVAANSSTLQANGTSLGATLDVMQELDLPTEVYRAQLLSVTQDLAAGLLDARLTARLLRQAWQGTTSWLTTNGPGWLARILLIAVILFAGRLVARLVRKALDKSLRRANLNISLLLERTIVSTAHNFVLALTVMIALSQLGVSLGPLLAGLGVVGFILGFAMQDSLSNFASGMMILFYRPYDVGDLVDISGVFGKVEHMSLVSTSILTLDNQKLVVPNSKIWGDVIKNVTDQKVRRVDMTFGISYSDDIPQAERVLAEILEQCEQVLDDPEPMVRLHTLNESSVDFVVRPWVKTADYWDVYWEVTRAVKMRFDEEGVSIPFPQRDVHLYQVAAQAGGPDVTEKLEPYPATGARDEDEEAGDAG